MNEHTALADNPKGGMPPENLAAVKTFLHAVRHVPEEPRFTSGPLAALPVDVQARLDYFLNKVRATGYFLDPDGKPKPEWRVQYKDSESRLGSNSTWDDVRAQAYEAAAGVDRVDVEKCAAPRAMLWAARRESFNRAAAAEAAKTAGEDAAFFTRIGVKRSAVRANPSGNWRGYGYGNWNACSDLSDFAGMMAMMIAVSDLDYEDKQKHEAFVEQCWEVFAKGYGMTREANGVLYVYCGWEQPK